ncbi:hypothetical protein QYE76_042367 [Lolium multiflorum]|uniref:Transposase (putative) gypsy type domain-containing protein n=1 Tax=Lolium multiflorum TaxID=4521 RepID=A0AAD8TF35_LOLMU|nr:hypothetical protein QYE76_042367 [Lolium multiflorum]
MGKKKGASTSDAAKVSRDWSASAISSRDINKLRNLGFISASEEDIRLPGAVTRPKPPKGFTVMFVAFLFRGLSLPAHEFLRSLLFFYGIQLWQLTPNSILHLSIFITVCEAFLGIDPHWGLWRKIFYVKRHNDSNDPPVVGGVGFVVRKDVDYLDYPMKESVQGWRNKWFYLRDLAVSGQHPNLPPFEDKLVANAKKSWQNALSPEERVIADKLFDQVVTLKNTGGLTMCGTEVLEANRLASDAKKENSLLKEEVSKLKQQMKDEQDARRTATVAIDKKEGVLRESVKDLLEAANITVTRRHQLREDSTADALSLAAESNIQVLGLLQKTKGALSRLYSMIFPKLLMGHGMGSELEKLSKALPVDDDNHLIDLEPSKRSAELVPVNFGR